MANDFPIRDEADRQRVMAFLAKLVVGKGWTVTLTPLRKKRSTDQNALYHKWCGIVAAETGNSHETIHEWAKAEFLPPVIVEIGGKTREIRASTTKLNTQEMSEFMTQFAAWAEGEMGIFLPRPEDQGRDAA